MAIDFGSLLTVEQKIEIIQQRINQFASEAYQLTLNRKSAETLQREEQLEIIDNNLVLLESAISIHQEELAQLS
ncbi:MAG: hypothetical protein F2740_00215 [Actinobacteria bacterium]|jgi:hypothetical protein|nr:hypothetical protein [Actinomycetota bacterium]